MRQVYFSHSYRDRSINSYFLDRFVREDFALLADQKSPTWCVAKLERYMLESWGFVSIIPRRATNKLGYSPYIGHELALARRATVPRLFFVDNVILRKFRADFPKDAVPFAYDEPGRYAKIHDKVIKKFQTRLQAPNFTPLAFRKRKKATVIAPNNKDLLQAADGIGAMLATSEYELSRLTGQELVHAFDDVRLLETLRDSDICVFILGDRISYANVVLGMAYAHCIPSVRLRYDRQATDTNPDVSGLIRWSNVDQLISAFDEQFEDFTSGMREAVSMAKSSSSDEAMESISKSRRETSPADLWNPYDSAGLVKHLSVEDSYVQDRVAPVQAQMKTGLGTDPSRKKSMEICRHLYDGLRKREDFVYDLEPQSMMVAQQPIRRAPDLDVNNSATCIDLACLFASLLEAAYQRSVIVVLDGPGYAHALAGYWAPDEPQGHQQLDLGTVRGAVRRGDLVVFEATGVAHSEKPVAGETEEQRRLTDNRKLDFSTAKKAAKNFLDHSKIELRFLVDINALRSNPPNA
ncbi:MAG: hypothetical protein O7G31_17010 [Calditrichaeota bacterium]|nr:hypothetical protein [Calditrichota bacterium]